MIDASIPLQVKPFQAPDQLNMMAQVLGLKQAQTQGELASYGLNKARRQDEQSNALMQALQGGSLDLNTPEGQAKAFSIAPEAAGNLIKARLDAKNTQSQIDERGVNMGAKTAETVTKTIAMHRDQLANVRDPGAAAQWVQAQYQDPVIGPVLSRQMPLQAAVASIPQDAQGFQRWVQQQALGMTEFIKQNAPKTNVVNAGGTSQIIQTPGLGGAPTLAGTVQHTVSPDAVLTDNRVRSEGAANRGVTIRGQDLTNQRQRESTAASITKPFEITGTDGKPVLVQQDRQGNIRPVEGYLPKQGASKPLTDTQAKALQFGSRMQAANDTIDALAQKGVSTSIPGSRAAFGLGATINALQPQERQQLDQAKRDFINAVLRRESGAAISPSEFDSAEKQYFPQPGETSPAIVAQKKANRELAMRGILAEVPDSDNRVKQVRGAVPAVSGGLPPDIAAILQKHGGR